MIAHIRRCLPILAFALMPMDLDGQSAARCTYDDCALRIEGVHLLEGSDARPVGRIGDFYTDLRILDAGPDSAALAAIAFRRQTTAGRWLGVGSLILAGAATVAGPTGFDALGDAPTLALYGSSIVLSQLAVRRFRRASSEIAQAVWYYNQGVVEGMPRPDPGSIPLRPSHYGHVGGMAGAVAGIALGLLVTSDLDWSEAAKGASITAGAGIAGGAIGWSIGTRRPRH